MTNPQEKNKCLKWQTLKLSDLKATIITIFHEKKVNTLEWMERQDFLAEPNEIIKKNQLKHLELKYILCKAKNLLDGFNSRMD